MLTCWKCRKKYPREIMIKQKSGNNHICPDCDAQIRKRKKPADYDGLAEWKCAKCGHDRTREEYYRSDLQTCKRCRSMMANRWQKEKRKKNNNS
jgi:transposase-like protein